jgi:hypothetical protein
LVNFFQAVSSASDWKSTLGSLTEISSICFSSVGTENGFLVAEIPFKEGDEA